MNIALIMAAGSGKRMKSEVPKQFLIANGKPLLIHTLEKFQNSPLIDATVLVCPVGYIEYCRDLVKEWNMTKCVSVVKGGAQRCDSSRIGVTEALKIAAGSPKETIVLIHDAARPFVTFEIIEANIAAAKQFGACETALRMTDTVVRGNNGFSEAIVPRDDLYRVQTPQSFRLDIIADAFENYDPATEGLVTDDAALLIRKGQKVAIVEGSPLNVKITSPEDMKLFR